MVRAFGKQRRGFFLQALDAGTDGRERIHRAALRAGLRLRHREAAMMADQPPLEPVIDQPGIAILAGEAIAAGAAQRQRRVTAPVQEQQRLLLLLQRELHRFCEPRRDEASARRAFGPHINGFDMR